MSKQNYFDDLYRLDVSGHVEKKNGFSYVSWPFAVAELRKRHPDAKWEVVRFDGKPFMQTDCGVFVEVAVTVEGVTLSQIHPVLNHANKPIANPTAFDINTSIQRCLVKAIALHGLGLYVYAGEDLPPDVKAEKEAEAAKPITEDQAVELQALMDETSTEGPAFCKFFKIPALLDLPDADYDRAVAMLQKKRAKA
jgi:hypothetical protein